MVEYGHGVGQSSGQGGSGGQVSGGGSADFGAVAVDFVSNAVDRIIALPPEGLLLLGILVLAGLVVLKRAF